MFHESCPGQTWFNTVWNVAFSRFPMTWFNEAASGKHGFTMSWSVYNIPQNTKLSRIEQLARCFHSIYFFWEIVVQTSDTPPGHPTFERSGGFSIGDWGDRCCWHSWSDVFEIVCVLSLRGAPERIYQGCPTYRKFEALRSQNVPAKIYGCLHPCIAIKFLVRINIGFRRKIKNKTMLSPLCLSMLHWNLRCDYGNFKPINAPPILEQMRLWEGFTCSGEGRCGHEGWYDWHFSRQGPTQMLGQKD